MHPLPHQSPRPAPEGNHSGRSYARSAASDHPFTNTIAGHAAHLLMLLLLAVTATGCATYAGRVQSARLAVYDGAIDQAAADIDALVAQAEAGRRTAEADYPLLLLERASLYQMLGDHERAVADFSDADGMLEILDLTRDPGGQAANYLWSDSRSLYRTPVYEKLMVNVCALASYLQMGDIVGARVEARRIQVMADYLNNEERTSGHPVIAIAWYLAGIAMELADERPDALRFYLDAWSIASLPGLPEALVRMADGTPFRTNSDVLRAREAIGLQPGDPLPTHAGGEVISIAMTGLPPIRQAVVMPIGLAIAAFRANASSNYSLSAEQEVALARAIAEDLLTTVNFPELVTHTNPIQRVSLSVAGRQQTMERLGDIEDFAIREWERQRPGMAFAAITRALVRIAAREVIQGVTRAADNGNGVARTIGFITSLAAQGAMAAADQPDTRSWTFMPASIWIGRVHVSAGEQTLTLRGVGGAGFDHQQRVTVPEGGATVVFVRSPL